MVIFKGFSASNLTTHYSILTTQYSILKMADTIRAFIAIELTDEVKDELAELQEVLKEPGADVKWVEKENMHLTLKFLGDASEEDLDRIKKALDLIAESNSPFHMHLSRIGAFPKPSFPRVLCVGMDKGKDELSKISKLLEDALSEMGFPKEEKPFSPHLTVGRVRSGQNKDRLIAKLEAAEFLSKFEVDVNKIVLFKSTLTSNGPIYEPLHKSLLGKPKWSPSS